LNQENGEKLTSYERTNNWQDYGGMDTYVKQIVGGSESHLCVTNEVKSDLHDLANHGDFYLNANVIAAFKKYIDTWIVRYKNETAILAWELANEPRCRGSSSTAGSCVTTGATITNWAKDISAYIKQQDPNHLVALGDEGFYQRSNPPSYPYGAGEGINFEENLKIATLDFGTFHMYPDVSFL
jgi:mannan endo-1,4-beta-mannosidase